MTVYFTASHSVRRFALITGLFLLSAGIAVTVLTAISPQDLRFILNYFFALLFVTAGAWFLKSAAKAETTALRIASEGLSYGTMAYSWDEIVQIGVMPGRREFYCTPRSESFAFEFSLTRRLTARQVKNLFERLARDVFPLHPHVQLSNGDEETKR